MQQTNTEIIKRNHVQNSPFTVITTEEGSFITAGKYRVSEIMTEEECIQKILDKDWDLIFSVVGIIAEHSKTVSNE